MINGLRSLDCLSEWPLRNYSAHWSNLWKACERSLVDNRMGGDTHQVRLRARCTSKRNGSMYPANIRCDFLMGIYFKVVSWLPLDVVAKCTLDVAFSKEQPPPVLNLWHPRPVPWNDLMGAVGSALSRQTGRRIPLVTFSEWVSILDQRARNPSTRDLQKIVSISSIPPCRS